MALAMAAVAVFGSPDQAAADDTSQLETNTAPAVLVTSTRLPAEQVALERVPAHVTVIDREQIESSPAVTATDLLRQEVGLVPTDTVGFGQFGNLTMRGFGERTGTLILVDGVRVNDAGESTLPYLWNTIPLENIERIEVIRGGASTTYGEGAIGGVINVITRQPAEDGLTTRLTGAGGNLGYYNLHADAQGRKDRLSFYASLDRQEWDGWREASGFRGWSAMVKPSLETEAGTLTLGYYFHEETVENPGVLTPDQFAADPRQAGSATFVFDNRVHRASLDYNHDLETGWTILGKVYGQSYDTDSTSAFGTGRVEQPNVGTTWQTSHAGAWFNRPNTFTVGGELIQQDFDSGFNSSFGDFTTGADNWTASVFAQNTLEILDELALTLGGRFDHRDWDVVVVDPFNPVLRADKHADVWSYKTAATWSPTEKTATWVSASRSFRLPTGFDIGAAGSTPGTLFFANPAIEPVDARTVEIGVRCGESSLLGGSLVYYYSEVGDDILFNPFTFQNENFDSVRQGVELALTSAPADWVDFYFTTAFTDARFDGGGFDDHHLPLVAEWQLTGGVNFRPVQALQLTLETVHVDGQVAANDLNNDFPRNQYVLVNAKARYTWKQTTLFVAVNNLLDRLYESYPTTSVGSPQNRAYNPAAGINVQAGATVTF